METVPDGLTHDQGRVLMCLTGHLEGNSRVEAAWLVGSLARGVGDRFSDVDVVAAVAQGALRGVVDEWPSRAASLLDLAFARAAYSAPTGTTFTHVTAAYVRFDVTFVSTSEAPKRVRGGISLLASSPVDSRTTGSDDPPSPAADRVRKLSEEFLRVLGMLPVVIGREEYLVAASGAALLRSMLTDLLGELAPPGYRGGAMRLERTHSRGDRSAPRLRAPVPSRREAFE